MKKIITFESKAEEVAFHCVVKDYLENNKESKIIVFLNFIFDTEEFNLTEEQHIRIIKYFISQKYKVVLEGLAELDKRIATDDELISIESNKAFKNLISNVEEENIFLDEFESTLASDLEIDFCQKTNNHIADYLRRIAHLKTLKRSEEIELAKLARNGNKKAREYLILANLKLVVAIAKKHIRKGIPLMELIEEGNLGLLKAVDKYDYTRGFRFSTYAFWQIRQQIFLMLSQTIKSVKVPLHLLDKMHKIAKAKQDLVQKYQREPTTFELAQYLEKEDLTEEKILMIESIFNNAVELDKTLGDDEEVTLIDMMEYDYGDSPVQHVDDSFKKDYLFSLLECLSHQQRIVIMHRYEIDGCQFKTLEELGKLFMCSRERIRQIEAYALKTLRKYALEKKNGYDVKFNR